MASHRSLPLPFTPAWLWAATGCGFYAAVRQRSPRLDLLEPGISMQFAGLPRVQADYKLYLYCS